MLSFIRSSILDTKLHFPNVALMWLLKSIAVIIMCSRPIKKTTFLIFYDVQQHENLNSDRLIVCFGLEVLAVLHKYERKIDRLNEFWSS